MCEICDRARAVARELYCTCGRPKDPAEVLSSLLEVLGARPEPVTYPFCAVHPPGGPLGTRTFMSAEEVSAHLASLESGGGAT